YFGGQRAAEHEACRLIVECGAQYECRVPAGLFMSRLRVQMQPDDVAAIRHVLARHYSASLPAGASNSTSSCRFSGLMRFTRSPSSYSASIGLMTITPLSSSIVTGEFSRSDVACTTDAGRRTAR